MAASTGHPHPARPQLPDSRQAEPATALQATRRGSTRSGMARRSAALPDPGGARGLAHRRAQAGEGQEAPRAVAADAAAGGRRVAAGVREGRILNKREQPYKPAVIRSYELALRLRVLPELGQRKLADIDLADLLELEEQLAGEGRSASRSATLRAAAGDLPASPPQRRRRDQPDRRPAPAAAGSRERAATPQEAASCSSRSRSPSGRCGRPRSTPGCDAASCGRCAAATSTSTRPRSRRARLGRQGRPDRAEVTRRDANRVPARRAASAPRAACEPPGQPGRSALRPHVETAFEPKNIARKASAAWKAANQQRARDEVALLEPITLHEARHSFSTFLDHAGVSEARADRYMGHSTGSVAGRYRHLLPGQIAEDRKLLDAYLGANTGKVVPLAVAE